MIQYLNQTIKQIVNFIQHIQPFQIQDHYHTPNPYLYIQDVNLLQIKKIRVEQFGIKVERFLMRQQTFKFEFPSQNDLLRLNMLGSITQIRNMLKSISEDKINNGWQYQCSYDILQSRKIDFRGKQTTQGSVQFTCCGSPGNRPILNFIRTQNRTYQLLKNYKIAHQHFYKDKMNQPQEQNKEIQIIEEKQQMNRQITQNFYLHKPQRILRQTQRRNQHKQQAQNFELQMQRKYQNDLKDLAQKQQQNKQFYTYKSAHQIYLQKKIIRDQQRRRRKLLQNLEQQKIHQKDQSQPKINLQLQNKITACIQSFKTSLQNTQKPNNISSHRQKYMNKDNNISLKTDQTQQQFDFPPEQFFKKVHNISSDTFLSSALNNISKNPIYKGKTKYKIKNYQTIENEEKYYNIIVEFICCAENHNPNPFIHYISCDNKSFELMYYQIHHIHTKNPVYKQQIFTQQYQQHQNRITVNKQVESTKFIEKLSQKNKKINKTKIIQKQIQNSFNFPLQHQLVVLKKTNFKTIQQIKSQIQKLRQNIKHQQQDIKVMFKAQQTSIKKTLHVSFFCCEKHVTSQPYLNFQKFNGKTYKLSQDINTRHNHKYIKKQTNDNIAKNKKVKKQKNRKDQQYQNFQSNFQLQNIQKINQTVNKEALSNNPPDDKNIQASKQKSQQAPDKICFQFPSLQQLINLRQFGSVQQAKMRYIELLQKDNYRNKNIKINFHTSTGKKCISFTVKFHCCNSAQIRPRICYKSKNQSSLKMLKNYQLKHSHKISMAKQLSNPKKIINALNMVMKKKNIVANNASEVNIQKQDVLQQKRIQLSNTAKWIFTLPPYEQGLKKRKKIKKVDKKVQLILAYNHAQNEVNKIKTLRRQIKKKQFEAMINIVMQYRDSFIDGISKREQLFIVNKFISKSVVQVYVRVRQINLPGSIIQLKCSLLK